MRARDIENLQPIRADFLHKLGPEIAERLGLPAKDVISIEIGVHHISVEAYVTDAEGNKVRQVGADDAVKHVFEMPITHTCYEPAPSGTHINGVTPNCELDRGHDGRHVRRKSGHTLYWGLEEFAPAVNGSSAAVAAATNSCGKPALNLGGGPCWLEAGHEGAHRYV